MRLTKCNLDLGESPFNGGFVISDGTPAFFTAAVWVHYYRNINTRILVSFLTSNSYVNLTTYETTNKKFTT